MSLNQMKRTRKTAAKTRISELLNKANTAMSSNDIHLEVTELCDRATVYRVLGRLVDEGVIHKVVDVDGVIKYAPCEQCSPEHHHDHIHFSCENCNMVTCLEEVVPEFKLPAGYTRNTVNFTVSGICAACNKK